MGFSSSRQNDNTEQIRFLRISRGLTAEGYYGLAKLFWALSYTGSLKAAIAQSVPRMSTDLVSEIETTLAGLRAGQEDSALISAVEFGLAAARRDDNVAYSDIPDTYVCRNCGRIIIAEAETLQSCVTCGSRPLTFMHVLPIWYFDPLSPTRLMQALTETPDEISHALETMTEAQMSLKPVPGEWSVRELLWHLLVTQELLAVRADKIINLDNPVLEGVAAWATQLDESLSATQILDRYRVSRQKTLSQLETIGAGDWWRTGMHSEFGQITLLQHVTYFARHEIGHLTQLDALQRFIASAS